MDCLVTAPVDAVLDSDKPPEEPETPPPSYVPPLQRGGSLSSLASAFTDACRICHCESELTAPLISPCSCSGTLKYVHQACLQQWIKSANTKSCELCKLDFQMTTSVKPFSKVSTVNFAQDPEQRCSKFQTLKLCKLTVISAANKLPAIYSLSLYKSYVNYE